MRGEGGRRESRGKVTCVSVYRFVYCTLYFVIHTLLVKYTIAAHVNLY